MALENLCRRKQIGSTARLNSLLNVNVSMICNVGHTFTSAVLYTVTYGKTVHYTCLEVISVNFTVWNS